MQGEFIKTSAWKKGGKDSADFYITISFSDVPKPQPFPTALSGLLPLLVPSSIKWTAENETLELAHMLNNELKTSLEQQTGF